METCNFCDETLTLPKSGLTVEGENLKTKWAGGSYVDQTDPFDKNGNYAPMNGCISFTICKNCLKKHLDMV